MNRDVLAQVNKNQGESDARGRIAIIAITKSIDGTPTHNISGSINCPSVSKHAHRVQNAKMLQVHIAVAHFHLEHQSVVDAIRQCKGLELFVAVEQTPETRHTLTREQPVPPRDVGKLVDEVFDTLDVGRAHKIV